MRFPAEFFLELKSYSLPYAPVSILREPIFQMMTLLDLALMV
jgi:hypothetical protein